VAIRIAGRTVQATLVEGEATEIRNLDCLFTLAARTFNYKILVWEEVPLCPALADMDVRWDLVKGYISVKAPTK